MQDWYEWRNGQVYSQYKQGMTISELAVRFDRAEATIKAIIRKIKKQNKQYFSQLPKAA